MYEKLKAQLRFEEGLKLEAYHCPAGHKTIGYGHNLDANPVFNGKRIPDEIDQDMAEKLLEHDIDQTIIQLHEHWHGFDMLTNARKDAVINMAFQLGISGFMKFIRLREALIFCNWRKAQIEALDSDWAIQTPARAMRVASQIMSGEYYLCKKL